MLHDVASPGSRVNVPGANCTSVSYTFERTRMELMSVSCPGSIDVGSATRPTTRVPGVTAPVGDTHRVPPATAHTVATTIRSRLTRIASLGARHSESCYCRSFRRTLGSEKWFTG